MIIWINGAFGSGKTTISHELHRRLPGSLLYDPEEAGFFIRKQIPIELHKGDFQDYPMWRQTNYSMLKYLDEQYSGVIIVPMTVVNVNYFEEIVGRLRAEGIHVRHFALCAAKEVLLRRLRSRGEGKKSWAAQQIDRCVEGLSHSLLQEQLVTDTMSIEDIVTTIAFKCNLSLQPDRRSRLRRLCDRLIVKIKHIRIK